MHEISRKAKEALRIAIALFADRTELVEPRRHRHDLRELVPNAATIGILVDSSFPPAGIQIKDAEEAVTNFGARSVVLRVKPESDLDAARSLGMSEKRQ